MAKNVTETTESASRISTQASSVYDRLQEDILSGRLEPGRKLRLKDLIEEYSTGNSPLREALNRLSANGMVVREENRGFRVPPARTSELMELTRTRCWLEEIALRQSIKNGDSDWEERIVLAFHWLSRAAQSTNIEARHTSPEWEEHHREFHLALISACDSATLIDFCEQLQKRTFRYRNLAEVVAYRDRHELEEHRELQQAVLNRNADLAVELLNRHYTITAEIVIESGRFE
jgi:DNA-binding GntR family transcriptional regulator